MSTPNTPPFSTETSSTKHNCFDNTSPPPQDPNMCTKGCPITPPKFHCGQGVMLNVSALVADYGEDWEEQLTNSDGELNVCEKYLDFEEEIVADDAEKAAMVAAEKETAPK